MVSRKKDGKLPDYGAIIANDDETLKCMRAAAQPGDAPKLTADALRTEIEELLEEIAGRAIDGNYAAPAREAYRTCGNSLAALLAAKPSSAPAIDTPCPDCSGRGYVGRFEKTPTTTRAWNEVCKTCRGRKIGAAPAPASTEAPAAPSELSYAQRKANETGKPYYVGPDNVSGGSHWVYPQPAAPSTEALIAAGDALDKDATALAEALFEVSSADEIDVTLVHNLRSSANAWRAAVAYPASEGERR